VEVDDHQDGAEGDAAELEVVGDHERHATDAGDQAGGETDQVDRLAEVDAVLDPDLGSHQTDHPVEHQGDPAEHPARGRGHHRPELRAETQQDRHDRRHVVGRGGVDAGRTHDADVLGVRRGGRAAERAGERGGDAVTADGAPHVGVEVLAGHLGHRLDVAGVLGDQRDHARQHEQDEGERQARAVHDVDPVAERAARKADPVGLLDRGPVPDPVVGGDLGLAGDLRVDGAEDHVGEPGQQEAEDEGQEDRDPGEEALEHDRRDDHERRRDQRDPLVLGPVDAGDDRGEVEADQHHDRTGDRGRKDRVDHPGAGEVHEDADQRQHDAGDHDRAGDVGGVAALGPDGGDTGHERGAGAEVARHLVGDDQQEQDRAESREHDREVGVQSHDEREHERRSEHRHHVLGTDAEGLGPWESLVRRDRLPRTGIHLLPAEHRHDASWMPDAVH
jgi:hypothetical protein